ncbi:MAG: hypothetical protein AAGI91_16210 [Bacteroidota bacterium]
MFLICFWTLVAGGGCGFLAPNPSDLDELRERYGDVTPGTFVIERGETSYSGCTRYIPPSADPSSPGARFVVDAPENPRSGTLVIPGLPQPTADDLERVRLLFDGWSGREGTFELLHADGNSASGVFSYEMRKIEGFFPFETRMEGGFHVRFDDLHDGTGC